MNKLNDRTYLYKEIDMYIKEIGLKNLLIVDNKKQKLNKRLIYLLEPFNIENINLYNKLFKSSWEYISYGIFDKSIINGEEYINLLNINDKYNIYGMFEKNTNLKYVQYVSYYLAIVIADDIVVNKVKNIREGFKVIDIALDLGKEIYALPGDIFDMKNYLANYIIKQGAIPICNVSDIRNILLQKDYKSI